MFVLKLYFQRLTSIVFSNSEDYMNKSNIIRYMCTEILILGFLLCEKCTFWILILLVVWFWVWFYFICAWGMKRSRYYHSAA